MNNFDENNEHWKAMAPRTVMLTQVLFGVLMEAVDDDEGPCWHEAVFAAALAIRMLANVQAQDDEKEEPAFGSKMDGVDKLLAKIIASALSMHMVCVKIDDPDLEAATGRGSNNLISKEEFEIIRAKVAAAKTGGMH